MSIKSLPKKISGGIKAKSNNIFQSIDFATGGILSLFVQTILKSHQGFIKEKFDNLLLDLAKNNIQEKELLAFINNTKLQSSREFLSNLLIKNFHADNRITIFILAKLWANRIKNGSLNYYESSLFTNINTFTHEDFEIYHYCLTHIVCDDKNKMFYSTVPLDKEYYVFAIDKLCKVGVLNDAEAFDGRCIKTDYHFEMYFLKTDYSDTLYQILDEYFKINPSK